MSLIDKEALALEQLEAERERRIDEKVEKGGAIRVPLPVAVVGGPEEAGAAAESARAANLAELRAAGEKREIYFEEDDAISVIVTGVPRAGRDDTYVLPSVDTSMAARHADYTEARDRAAALAYKPPPLPKPTPQPDMSEPRYVRTEISPTSEKDCGIIIEGRYTIDSNNLLRVHDMQGNLIGTEQVRPGDDVVTVAKRLLRKGAAPSFFAPLRYPPSSVH